MKLHQNVPCTRHQKALKSHALGFTNEVKQGHLALSPSTLSPMPLGCWKNCLQQIRVPVTVSMQR